MSWLNRFAPSRTSIVCQALLGTLAHQRSITGPEGSYVDALRCRTGQATSGGCQGGGQGKFGEAPGECSGRSVRVLNSLVQSTRSVNSFIQAIRERLVDHAGIQIVS